MKKTFADSFLLLLTVFAVLPASAWPLGLGDIEVKSAFNKRFTAIIPVFLGEEEKDLTIEVGRPTDYELMQLPRPDFIDKLELAVAPNPDKPSEKIIFVSSPVPIDKPSFNLIIRASAGGGTVLENYFLAVDFRKSLTLELPKQEKIEEEVIGQPEARAEEVLKKPPVEKQAPPPPVEKERPEAVAAVKEPEPEPAKEEPPAVAEKPAMIVVEKPAEPEKPAPIVVEKISEPEKPAPVVEVKIAEPSPAEKEPEEIEVSHGEFIKVSLDSAKNRHLVRRRENLYLIAKKLGAKKSDLAKVAVALYLENRSAFIGGNIHKLKAGVKLNFDRVNEVAAKLTRFDSSALIARHDALRKTGAGKAPIPIEAPLDSQPSAKEIYAFLENWKKQWMKNDMEAFADSYAGSFSDRRGRNRSEFLTARARFNKNHVNIRLLFENISIVRGGPIIELYFTQWFRSDNYASVGLKRLTLLPSARGLKIMYEEFTPRRASSERHSWTVHLASYQGMATTRARIERLRTLGFRAFEASSFRIDDVKWYRLMVGRLAGKSQAANLARKLKKAGEPYMRVLKLPFALEVSVYDNQEESVATAKKLRESGLSPYLLETAKTSGKSRYAVYVGAFFDSDEAEKTLKRLMDTGLDLRITTP
jgi:hypothetical protein